jgi:hypothetical protein
MKNALGRMAVAAFRGTGGGSQDAEKAHMNPFEEVEEGHHVNLFKESL